MSDHSSHRGGRRIDAQLHLLDRQIVDPDGCMAGKVDDLELEQRGEGPPYVSAVLSGPGALAGRIGGRVGHWIEVVSERLQRSPRTGPARIPFGLVAEVGTSVRVSVPRHELESFEGERWARDIVIAKIPGSGHAAE